MITFVCFHTKVSLTEIYKYTLKELITLHTEIRRILIYETGKQISLTGSKDAEAYINTSLMQLDPPEEFEVDEKELYKQLNLGKK